MIWSEILIILVSALGAAYIFIALESKHQDVKFTCLFVLISIIFFQINKLLDYSSSWIVSEVLLLSIFSMVLVILLITNRKLKPEFARYPYILTYFPIVIPILYPLITGNESIIELVLQLIQIAAILSLIFILLSHFEEKRELFLTTLAVILLTSSGILFWIEELNYIGFWLWQTLAAIGLGLLSFTLTKFYNSNSSINRYGHY
ncbi:hypothetical protein [Rhodohalobacter sp.]|uniref:hypothetical protein n=1 Tax=Rhodohalobacter sp. TaxID=1974210 RepID=UPI00356144D7